MGSFSNSEFDRARREYNHDRLDDYALPDDPFLLFSQWMEEAMRSNSPDPTAMTLSTVDEHGTPSSRIVLLKKIDQNKLIFFSNYHSKKAREIKDNPRVAAHFYWPELERQVKISGIAGETEVVDSDRYFSSRPFESKVSAWASPQSKEIPDRLYLEKEYQKYLIKFKKTGEVPRPGHWGGYFISPRLMEFWQGGRFRLHDRIAYSFMDNRWKRIRLAP
jgi:pyridoxamine 5'-phosphate oxidase